MAVAFDVIDVQGIPDRSYTSLQFGPDGRLYASDRLGEIFAFDIEQLSDSVTGKVTGYKAVATEVITAVRSIPNHNDDGQLNTGVTERQVTGILVAGTANEPVIYVGSSDPREGGGSGGGVGDTNLDTNSGVISRLSWNGSGWDKVDLVRGLPRSEENHSTNGLALTVDPVTGHKILLVAQGGHTNAGAPSQNFAFSTEYALSAAILSVDLTRLENPTQFPIIENGAHDYVYNLPTVKGTAQPFGGQDGLNQARLVAGGPVQVYSSGYRNAYDVVVTADGDIFSIDNGANAGWGGLPSGEGTTAVTNRIPTVDPDGFNSVNDLDHLHHIPAPGYYAGHPNPIRANPTGAGILYTNSNGQQEWTQTPTGNWPPVDATLKFPNDNDFRLPGVSDGALTTWSASTNGLDEYTASVFEGAMRGDLITASFDGSIYRIVVNGQNTSAAKEAIASGLDGVPLDVIAQGDNGIFASTIWVGFVAGASDISVLVPTTLSGTPNDSDGDGYTNSDEIANLTNQYSPSSTPPDNDRDFTSDLNDKDDDNDSLLDPSDHFARDGNNGTSLLVTKGAGFFNPLRNDNPGFGFEGVGFTGWMSNGKTDYLDQYDANNVIAGGTSGIFSIVKTTAGDARGSLNTQANGFQFGVVTDFSGTSGMSFVVSTRMLNVLAPLTQPQLQNGQSAGIQIGTGDQDNYIKVAVAANQGGVDIAVLHEENGIVAASRFEAATISIGDQIELFFEVNPDSGTVTPAWQVNGGQIQLGSSIVLREGSKILSAIWGAYQNGNVEDSSLAVGLISTHGATGKSFAAQYDDLKVYAGAVFARPGTAKDDTILGTAGDDILNGLGGEDTIYGSYGNDWVNGGSDADSMHGGAGNDTFIVDSAGDKVLADESGVDTVRSAVSFSLVGTWVEKLVLTGSANINGTGGTFNNTMIGNSGANTLNGGRGNDVLAGGAGNDTFIVDSAGDKVLADESGVDTVRSAVSFSLVGTWVEKLVLTGSADINGTGGSFNNTMTGNSGADTLKGGRGNDVLAGGLGKDELWGQAGSDTFDFNLITESRLGAAGHDLIQDWDASDKIDTRGLDANAGSPGDQDFVFIGETAPNNAVAQGELKYYTSGGNTYVVLNQTPDMTADFQIFIRGVHDLTETNFLGII